MIIFNKALLPFIIMAILAGCAGSPPQKDGQQSKPKTEQPDITNPEELVRLGKIRDAAELYLALSRKATHPERETLRLKGIQLFIKNESFKKADNLLADINPGLLKQHQFPHYAYLNAHISLISRNAESSLSWLKHLKNKGHLPFTDEATLLKLTIAIYELANDNPSATLNRISLESFLTEEPEILANQQAIIRGLLLLSEKEHAALPPPKSQNDILWRELTALINNSKNPFRLGSQLSAWKALNPNIHIRDEIIATLAPQQNDEKFQIDAIALLLPQSGPFQKPAAAIRDGFLANYYSSDAQGNRPTIRFYDTNNPNSTLLETYQQAVNDGANIIVGPLQKKAVEIVAKLEEIKTPTLVLNQLEDHEFYQENLYQFALSPEFEAKQTAQRAWQDGHTRAAIIYPDNTWGNRVTNAFKEEWLLLGGELVTEEGYETKKNDFSIPLKALLSIDESHERKKALSKLLRTSLTFDARRRQDIDFIFMAAFPRQARLIPPQLKFFHAGTLPVYATSHSFSGKINRKKDRDLDRVIIGDMPWTLTNTKNNNTKQNIYKTWPNESKQFNRLYALGNDAYYVLNYLNWLRSNSLSQLDGATGKLHMSETNQILRTLTWAKFRNGTPRLLPSVAKLDN